MRDHRRQRNAWERRPKPCPAKTRKVYVIMKTQRVHQSRFFAALLAITMSCALTGAAATDGTSADLPHAVSYQLGDAKFAPGDNITIQQMRGTSDTITTGETYSLEGTYTLSSKDEADLAFYATTVSPSGPTPVDPKQHIRSEEH